MLCKLTWALTEDNRVIHISEAERGASCRCICPACGDTLIARKGDETGHHFAHSAGDDCAYSFTSSLYYAIYRTINELGYLVLPPYIKNRSVTEHGSGTHIIMPQAKVKVERSELTRKASAGITGIIAYCSGKPLLIKILTAYTIKKRNMSKIQELGLPLLEIDLSRNDFLDKDTAVKLLTTAPPQIYWVYNRRAETIWEQLISRCEKLDVAGTMNSIYTYGCPIASKREDGFKCFIKTGCSSCGYFFGLCGFDEDRYVLCGRRQVITEASDLLLTIDERKKKYNITR